MYTYVVGHASQQGSCDAVPLLCGGLAVQGASPYTPPHQTGPTSWAPVDTCPQQDTTNSQGDSHATLEYKLSWRSDSSRWGPGHNSIQGPWTVHEADRAIMVTRLLSCTDPRCSWHGLAPLHVATHRALVHNQSILLGIWSLLAGSCA